MRIDLSNFGGGIMTVGAATLTRWGNSQGVIIPKDFCDQLRIRPGDKLEMTLDGTKIVMEPKREHTLEARLAQWDGGRFETHEYGWGEPEGKEIW